MLYKTLLASTIYTLSLFATPLHIEPAELEFTQDVQSESETGADLKKRSQILKNKIDILHMQIKETLSNTRVFEVGADDLTNLLPDEIREMLNVQKRDDLIELLREEYQEPDLVNLVKEVINLIQPADILPWDAESEIKRTEYLLNVAEAQINKLQQMLNELPKIENQLESDEMKKEFSWKKKDVLMMKAYMIRDSLQKALPYTSESD